MDDSCAVCADALEWVAYGPCGHREVCSTCVSRLRFICNDRRCCICKTESDVIFVTKALGDYTRMINDFLLLPTEVKEGRTGSYWYHEDTQAFFDDVDHYKMIKAMCKLSCSVCDKMDEQQTDGSKRQGRFRNIEQLKGHLFHKHKLFMCSLCLEGRKVFICEQNLYTRAQLNQHISTGDSEVDGSESERGGFSGHPMCAFCRNPFYGDNELYTHMSTEHYTCHICQRKNPGQYEYYKNYEDLEMHFLQSHFLCEDDACLAKKFIVFQSEAEMKRHNAIEHGGRMSRAKRNAVLQIPTSFRYRRDTEHDHRRRRGCTFHRDFAEDQLSMAIEASLETANGNNTQPNLSSSSSSGQVAPDIGDATDSDPIIQPFESLNVTDSESSSRYLQALGPNSRNGRLVESSFPPLFTSTGSSQVKQQESLPSNNLAAHLRHQRKVTVLNSGQAWPAASREPALQPSKTSRAWPAASREPALPPSNTSQAWPAASREPALPPSNTPQAWPAVSREPALPPSNPSQAWPAASREPALPPSNTSQAWPVVSREPALSLSNTSQAWPEATREPALPPSNTSQAWPTMNAALGTSRGVSQNKTVIGNSRPGSSSIDTTQVGPTTVHGPPSNGSLRDIGYYSRITHTASAPNLVNNGSFGPSASDFPPVSAAQVRKLPSTSQALQNTDNVHTANKSLVEKIRSALEFDLDKFSAFKEISGEYRQGLLDTETYLDYVQQFGLLHLVLDLAKLCPDVQKQTELIKSYKARSFRNSKPSNSQIPVCSQVKAKKGSNKGKGKCLGVEDGNSKDTTADELLGTARKCQSGYKLPEEELEVLSKDGYRSARGKSKLIIEEQPQVDLNHHSDSSIKTTSKKNVSSTGIDSGQKTGEGGGGNKQWKKTSKFHRVRLGDGTAAALSNLTNSNPHPDGASMDEQKEANTISDAGLPVHGVWRKGSHKLFS